MLWQSPDIIQTNLMLLSFSSFYFLVFCCTNYVCIISLAKLHFTNLFGLLIPVPPKTPNDCFYRYQYLKIVLENKIALYIIYIYISLEYNSQSLEDLQALTALKHYQQYSTLTCPYYVNETSKKKLLFWKSWCETPHKQKKQTIITTTCNNASEKWLACWKGCYHGFWPSKITRTEKWCNCVNLCNLLREEINCVEWLIQNVTFH